jgi:hypothetical protein
MSEKISGIHAAPSIKAIRWPPQKDELPVEAFAELGRRLNREISLRRNVVMTTLRFWPGVIGRCGYFRRPHGAINV